MAYGRRERKKKKDEKSDSKVNKYSKISNFAGLTFADFIIRQFAINIFFRFAAN